jgi:glycosyltransferase involved in cell wall biosynthesis
MISFAIPNFNRTTNVIELIKHHVDDSRIQDIVVCDDGSATQVVDELESFIKDTPKVKLIRNDSNVGPYLNKKRTVEHCLSDWVVLCDSDNFINKTYIDVLYDDLPWQEDTIYCPSFAKPHFDYRGLVGVNISNIIQMDEVNKKTRMGPCFLNTGNFFFHRNNYIDVAERGLLYCKDKHSCDVIAFNYFWIMGGNKMKCVGDLEYDHDLSDDSVYKTESTRAYEKVQERLNEVNSDIHNSALEVN